MYNVQSINYMGSKTRLLPFLSQTIPWSKDLSFFDGFCGSVRISGAVKALCKSVTACDKQPYSGVLGEALLKENRAEKDTFEYLQSLEGSGGYIAELYGGAPGPDNASVQQDGKTRLFTRKNAEKIQAIRDAIRENFRDNTYLLYCLMVAAARVQSSTGHQNGYLKFFSKNALNAINFVPIDIPLCGNEKDNRVVVGDIFDNLGHYHDIFYFDPPYGTINTNVPVATRYSAFYHFWNTLVLHDNPKVFGAANRRIDSKANTDAFEVNKKDTFLPLIKRLFLEANGRDVYLSLSNQAIVSKKEVLDYCGLPLHCYECPHKENVQGLRTKKQGLYSVAKEPLIEYLYHLRKN